ncbi:putative ABC transport system permease protein [Inhella inkyongensis]|uniref:Putative ABC transport system permease protein n=1 Tax=Inhella inkyongensis TaxID=392593 RepID=A0A840S4M8_9BURK|nr:FtsX-like permease family protein [Inhella inkyongensis]MBB5203459.1 putative ABC transport system permease protein [Inhella inkyongensis]
MLSQFAPILSTLKRHKIAAGLIVLEVALSFALISNALHVVQQRVSALNSPTGLPESELLAIEVRATRRLSNPDQLSAEDLRRLRALPGVQAVSIANQVLYGDNSNNSGAYTEPEQKGLRLFLSTYEGDEHMLKAHGMKLLAGRAFLPDEVQLSSTLRSQAEPRVPVIIVNRAVAEALAPGRPLETVLGRALHIYGEPGARIVGVVDGLQPPYPREARDGRYASLVPVAHSYRSGSYILRVAPADQARVLAAARQIFKEVEPSRLVLRTQTLLQMRQRYWAPDRALVWTLVGVCSALLVITALGIVGLASFWVEQRGRMIGIRRALGATRSDILRYFQLENALLCGLGVLLGTGAALGINQWLVASQGLPVRPLMHLLPAAVTLLLLGQLAVWAPARRASGLAPALAMRAG